MIRKRSARTLLSQSDLKYYVEKAVTDRYKELKDFRDTKIYQGYEETLVTYGQFKQIFKLRPPQVKQLVDLGMPRHRVPASCDMPYEYRYDINEIKLWLKENLVNKYRNQAVFL